MPAPIDIQVTGPLPESETNYRVAQQIAQELRGVPGAVDVHVQQILDAPRITIDNDRILAQQSGLTQPDVASSVLLSLSGSGATSNNFCLNYTYGVCSPGVTPPPLTRILSLVELPRSPPSHTCPASTPLLTLLPH